MKFSMEHFVPCWPTSLAFINMSLQCQHNLSSSTQNQISTTESAVKLQETAAIFSYPILPMTVHTLQKYNAAPKKYAKIAGRIQLFPLHHQKTKTKQKHSHTPDNGRVRLRRGIKFLVGYHQKKIFPLLFPQASQNVWTKPKALCLSHLFKANIDSILEFLLPSEDCANNQGILKFLWERRCLEQYSMYGR